MKKILDIELKKLIPFVAGKNDYRQSIKCIHIKDNTIFAVDGYVLACKNLSTEDNLPDENYKAIISVETFEKAMNMIDKKSCFKKIHMEQIENKLIFSTVDGAAQVAEIMSKEESPSIERLWPTDEPEATIAFNAELLEKICKLAKGNYSNRIVFKIHKNCALFKAENGFYGMIMPLRSTEKELI